MAEAQTEAPATQAAEAPAEPASFESLTNFDEIDLSSIASQHSFGVKRDDESNDQPDQEDVDLADGGDGSEADDADDDTDGKSASKKEDKEEDEPEEKAVKKSDKEKDSKEDAKQEEVKDAKIFKVKSGDSEVEVRADTEFEVKVNGKTEKVPVQELLNNYSGKVNWDRKFGELGHEKAQFQKDQAVLQKYVSDLHTKLVEENDLTGALWMLADAMGGNPAEVVAKTQQLMLEKVQGWSELSPEARQLKELEERQALYQRQMEAQQLQAKAAQEQSQLERRMEAVKQSREISDEKFVNYYRSLEQLVPPEELTPELIGEYHDEVTAFEALHSLLKDVNPEMPEEELSANAKELRQVQLSNKDLTVEDLKDIAVEVYGDKRAQNLSRKIKKASPKGNSKPPAPKKGGEIWSFDQL